MIRDGLWDVYNDLHMGLCGDRCAARYQFTRQDQDDFAVASYQRALEAQRQGRFAQEIAPVEIVGRKGTVTVAQDEEPVRFQEDKLRGLKPAFGKEGTVTAGNASSINDGAAAVVVLSGDKARQLGVRGKPGSSALRRFRASPSGLRSRRSGRSRSCSAAWDGTSPTSICSRSTRPFRSCRWP